MSRSVLVTGGNRGIGLAIAKAFAEAKDGADSVAVTYRLGEPPEGVYGVRCDVTDTASVEAAFADVEAQQGPVEVLVANAGITRDQLVLRMSDEDFWAVVNTNLAGAFRCARRASKGMLRLRRGRLVFVSSVVALSGGAGQTNYAASKAGLVGLARSLARELGSRGITANVVAPGFVDTAMTAELGADRRAEILAQVPLGRYASADEVAGVVRFLASDAAAYITGAVVPVDGGLGMGH
jgi:3-oxoacyl-[acyl-carrier protein] reductase